MRKVVSFDSVEEFWGTYNNIVPPSLMPGKANYYLFRVRPLHPCRSCIQYLRRVLTPWPERYPTRMGGQRKQAGRQMGIPGRKGKDQTAD